MLIRVKTSQRRDAGRVIYANCITLTPGTVSIDVTGDEIVVHALTREAARDLASGEMDRRVTRYEGRR
jgi:multicomponent Na+:H+ antiporter subunit E